MMVLKPFIYIQYGCGMQSAVVYSLNHDTTTSFRLHFTPVFQNMAPTCIVVSCKHGTQVVCMVIKVRSTIVCARQ